MDEKGTKALTSETANVIPRTWLNGGLDGEKSKNYGCAEPIHELTIIRTCYSRGKAIVLLLLSLSIKQSINQSINHQSIV